MLAFWLVLMLNAKLFLMTAITLSHELTVIFYYFIFTVGSLTSFNCTIVSTNLATVTATGGAIANGTQNVIIYCLCIRNNIAAVGGAARWFLNGIQITETADTTGGPYLRSNIVPNQLIIPSFCGTR